MYGLGFAIDLNWINADCIQKLRIKSFEFLLERLKTGSKEFSE